MTTLQILAQLDECKNIPDFNNYLAFILSQGDTLPVEVALRFYYTSWLRLHCDDCEFLVSL